MGQIFFKQDEGGAVRHFGSETLLHHVCSVRKGLKSPFLQTREISS